MGTGGGNVPMVMEQHTFANVAACRNAQDGRGGVHSQMMDDPEGNFVLDTVTASKATFFTGTHQDGVAETLVATDYKDPQVVAYEKNGTQAAQDPDVVCSAVDCRNGVEDADKNGSLQSRASNNINSNNVCRVGSVVRRLTPLECERLQGFPDHWTDIGDWVDSKGKKHKGESDSPRYKALGNSIALPFWKWMAKRMRNYLGDKPTMASLFDGIGGFPLSYAEEGVKPVWASEIEEFPIAVTKIRFPSNEEVKHDGRTETREHRKR
jgi:DNA (cytosine-5)-methyltransferase 1